MVMIKLQSSDMELFETDLEIAKCSGTIRHMLDVCGMDVNEGAILPLPNVKATTLRLVLQWANHHKDDYESDNDDDYDRDYISSWDAEFLKVDQSTLFELVSAANYLDITGLFNVSCRTVANMISKGLELRE